MTDYRIAPDEWKRHDMKKLWGLILLLLAAVLAYAFGNQTPSAPAPELPAAVPSDIAPPLEKRVEKMPDKPLPPADIPFTLESHKDGSNIGRGDTVFSGRAKPGSKVQMYIDKYLVGATTATEAGTWEITRFVHESGTARQVKAQNVTSNEYTPTIALKVD